MLNRKNRIGNRQVIEKLYQKGSLLKDHFLVFKYEKTDSPSQFAITVSKKISKKAVKRNRLRRQLYEAIRHNLPELKENLNVLIIARPPSQKATFKEISESIKTFFKTA